MKPKPVTQNDWIFYMGCNKKYRYISKRQLTSAVAGLKLDILSFESKMVSTDIMIATIDEWLQGVAKNSSDPKWRLEE